MDVEIISFDENRTRILLCRADASKLSEGQLPCWCIVKTLAHFKKAQNIALLYGETQAFAKQHRLPILAPLPWKRITIEQLKLLPQTDEVKVLAVRLALMQGKMK